MKRRIVQIAKMCVDDVQVGDTVGSDPNGNRGWFVVDEVVTLINGDLSLVGNKGRSSVTAAPRDVVGFQVRQVVEMAAEELPAAPVESTEPDSVPPDARAEQPEAQAEPPEAGPAESSAA